MSRNASQPAAPAVHEQPTRCEGRPSPRRHCRLHLESIQATPAVRPTMLDALLAGRTLSVPLAVETCALSHFANPYSVARGMLEAMVVQGIAVRIPANDYAPVRYVIHPEYRSCVEAPRLALLAD